MELEVSWGILWVLAEWGVAEETWMMNLFFPENYPGEGCVAWGVPVGQLTLCWEQWLCTEEQWTGETH